MIVGQVRADRDHGAGQSQPCRTLQLPGSVRHVVQVYHGDALEFIRVSRAELGQVVVVSPERRRQHVRGRHAEQGQSLGWVEHSPRNTVQIHVLDVLVRVKPAQGDGFHGALNAQFIRVFKPDARLLVYPNGPEPQAIADPLIRVLLVKQPRPALFEAGVDAVLPKVFGFDDVGIR